MTRKLLFLIIISLGILISGFLIAASFSTVTDTFNDESKIASKINLVVSGGQVKLAICKDNGCFCSSDAGCDSGICGTDADGDNYFSQSAGNTGICQASSKPYTDCCDSDANSHPGADYYQTVNNCGFWDWDCNSVVEQHPEDDYGVSQCSYVREYGGTATAQKNQCTYCGQQCNPQCLVTICTGQYCWGEGLITPDSLSYTAPGYAYPNGCFCGVGLQFLPWPVRCK